MDFLNVLLKLITAVLEILYSFTDRRAKKRTNKMESDKQTTDVLVHDHETSFCDEVKWKSCENGSEAFCARSKTSSSKGDSK